MNIMSFPIKKRAATKAKDTNSDGDSRNGLDLLSAVIDACLVHNRDESAISTSGSTKGSTVTSTLSSPTVVENMDCDDGDSSIISDHHSTTSTTEISMSPKTNHSSNSDKRAKTFPEVLMDILSNPDNESIVGWLQHGKSFAIHNSTLFQSQILPKYFRRVIFRSFVRKLNRWGFRSSKRSISGFASTFEHKYFRRDEPELCAKIFCTSNPTRRITTGKMRVAGGIKPENAVNGDVDDIMTVTAPPNPNPASSRIAATPAALSQSHQQLPLLNIDSSLTRLAILNEDLQAQLSRTVPMNYQIRTASASAPICLVPPSTNAVLSAALSQAVLSQAHRLSVMNSVHMLSPPAFTSAGTFPLTHNEERQIQLSNELLLLELQRQKQQQQKQQALLKYLFYLQE